MSLTPEIPARAFAISSLARSRTSVWLPRSSTVRPAPPEGPPPRSESNVRLRIPAISPISSRHKFTSSAAGIGRASESTSCPSTSTLVPLTSPSILNKNSVPSASNGATTVRRSRSSFLRTSVACCRGAFDGSSTVATTNSPSRRGNMLKPMRPLAAHAIAIIRKKNATAKVRPGARTARRNIGW